MKHADSWCQQEDHELFDLVTKLEGKGTTFYSWPYVPSTTSTSDIAKAYRKNRPLRLVFLLYPLHLRAIRNTNTFIFVM
jgi:hypothetical protein